MFPNYDFYSDDCVQKRITFFSKDFYNDEEIPDGLSCAPPMLDYVNTGIKVKSLLAFGITIDNTYEEQKIVAYLETFD